MPEPLTTGIEPLDRTLDGLPGGTLVQVHGPPGAGKSSLTLTIAREAQPAAVVLTERLHPKRVGAVLDGAAERVLVARPGDLAAQQRAVEAAARLLSEGKVRLAALDSLTFFYRFERLSDTDALQQLLGQLHQLHQAARESGGVALFTNQVRGTGGHRRPLGGPAIGHAADVVMALAPREGPWRRLSLEKHPYAPEDQRWDVRIRDDGIG